MAEEIEAKLASGRKAIFVESEEGNSCGFFDCESEFVRIKNNEAVGMENPERLYCYKHCSSKKRNKYQ